MAPTNLLQRSPFARAMADHPLVFFDVGARGGIDADLGALAFATDVAGFEPDGDEFERISQLDNAAAPWRSVRFLPFAVAGETGRRSLHVTADPQSTTLLDPDAAVGAYFDKPQFFTVEKEVEVETVSLDDAVTHLGLGAPDVLKLDVEGAELEILEGGREALSRVVAIKTEVSFIRFRKGQPVAADLDAWLREENFVLMDYMGFSRWRQQGYVIHPHTDFVGVPYSRGQIAHGDALYFRSPEALAATGEEPAVSRLKAAFVAMAYGFFDHAGVLLDDDTVAALLSQRYGIDVKAALRRTSKTYSRQACVDAFLKHLRATTPFARTLLRLLR